MSASISINQVGLPAGAADSSRSDGLDNGAMVTVTSDVPGSTNTFSLLWVPNDDITAVASLTPAGASATFLPTAGVYGTYRIKLVVDATLPTESTIVRTFSIRTLSAGLRIPALNEGASPLASLVNSGPTYIRLSETNEAGLAPFAAGNYGGFYSSLLELYAAVEALVAGGGGGGAAYRLAFTDVNLIAGVLTVAHGLAVRYNAVMVYDNANEAIIPSSILDVGLNHVSINLASYQVASGGAIPGTWHVVVRS